MQACWITVQYDLVLLRVSQGARGLTWRLPPGRDYEFAGNGIVIDPSKFRCSANGPYIFVCDATTTDFAAHKYDVNVRHRSGTRQVAPLDPWVVTN